MRFLLRIMGYLGLASGFLTGVVDGTRSIASGTLEWCSLAAAVNWLAPRTIGMLEEGIPRLVHPLLWNPVMTTLLHVPAMVTGFALGLLLLWLGRPRPEVIDLSN